MGLAFIPLYIQYLGIEAYGLIGVFAILQAWLTLLDFGMTPILTREMARLNAGASEVQTSRDLLRGTEILLFSAAAVLMVVAWLTSPWFATHWLRPGAITVATVALALTLMAAVACARSLEGVYRGCAMGQDQQVGVNVVAAAMATLRGVGAIGVLAWISSTITAFFIWQLVISIVTLAVLALMVYRGLPIPRVARFSFQAWTKVGGFARGMVVITIFSLLLTQVDKVILSRMLSLQEYGYYALSAVVASSLYLIVVPIAQAFFPRFSEALAKDDMPGLARSYHQGAQLVSVLLGPAALVLTLFSAAALRGWTGDLVLASEAAPLLTALSLGTLLNGLMWIPFQMQLAHGHTRTALSVNAVAVAVAIPSLLWVTPRYGAVGAAWVWVALNASYLVLGINLMYRQFLGAERRRWYLSDVASPLLASAAVAALCRGVMPAGLPRAQEMAWLFASMLLSGIAGIAAAPEIRTRILTSIPIRGRQRLG